MIHYFKSRGLRNPDLGYQIALKLSECEIVTSRIKEFDSVYVLYDVSEIYIGLILNLSHLYDWLLSTQNHNPLVTRKIKEIAIQDNEITKARKNKIDKAIQYTEKTIKILNEESKEMAKGIHLPLFDEPPAMDHDSDGKSLILSLLIQHDLLQKYRDGISIRRRKNQHLSSLMFDRISACFARHGFDIDLFKYPELLSIVELIFDETLDRLPSGEIKKDAGGSFISMKESLHENIRRGLFKQIKSKE